MLLCISRHTTLSSGPRARDQRRRYVWRRLPLDAWDYRLVFGHDGRRAES